MKNIPKLPSISMIEVPSKRFDTRTKFKVTNVMTVEQFKTHVQRERARLPESQLQRQCIAWFDQTYPAFSQLMFAIPNGGKRRPIEAKIMKAEGVRAGVADLFLAVPRLHYAGMFIEMKSADGYLRPEQKQFLKAVETNYMTLVCRSFDQFEKSVKDYLS